MERILRYPFTMIGSDGEIPLFGKGAPHPRSYGTFALPAARLGLDDRGLLRPGMKADLAVFDPALVADQATFDNPHQYAAGVRHVLVNGRPVVRDGKVTGERPGRVLYGPARPQPQ